MYECSLLKIFAGGSTSNRTNVENIVTIVSSRLCAVINEFRCYEVKIEESEKAGSRRESNPGHLWLQPPVLSH